MNLILEKGDNTHEYCNRVYTSLLEGTSVYDTGDISTECVPPVFAGIRNTDYNGEVSDRCSDDQSSGGNVDENSALAVLSSGCSDVITRPLIVVDIRGSVYERN